MLSSDIIEYLQNCKLQDAPFLEVEKELHTHGLTDDQIKEARVWYDSNTTQPSSPVALPFDTGPGPGSSPKAVALLEEKRSPWVLLISAGLGILLLLCIAAGLMGGLAYGYIPWGGPGLRIMSEDVVMSLPFAPKTPQYVFRRMAEAQKRVYQSTIELRVSATAQTLENLFGTPTVEVVTTGPIDLSQNSYLALVQNISVLDEINLDLRLTEKKGYLRMNEVSKTVERSLSLPEGGSGFFTNQWVWFDAATLNTSMRKGIATYAPDLQQTNKTVGSYVGEYIAKQLVPRAELSKESLQDVPMYKLTTKLTEEDVDAILSLLHEDGQPLPWRKISQLEDITLTVWVDPQTYYMQQVSFTIKGSTTIPEYEGAIADFPLAQVSVPAVSEERFSIVVLLRFDGINRAVTVQEPQDAVTFSTFVDEAILRIATAPNKQLVQQSGKQEELQTLLALEEATLRFFYVRDSFPDSLDELLAQLDFFPSAVQGTIAEDIQTDEIQYVLSGDKRSVLISMHRPDESNEDKPIRAIILYDGQSSSLQNVSETEVELMQSSFELLEE